jgi:hypothetical protein
MRLIRTMTAVATLFAAGISLVPRQAEALPCCSVCARNPRVCHAGCSPSCRAEDQEETARLIYDEQIGLCYIAE